MAFTEIIRDTSANFIFLNPTLLANQIGVETDVRDGANVATGRAKIGDGETEWNNLGYWSPTFVDNSTFYTINKQVYITGALNVSASLVTQGILTAGGVASTFVILSTSPSGGIGYSTGSGGAVTQLTDRSTGVTLNKVNGAITLVSAAGSATPVTFTVTNSQVTSADTVIVSQKSGTDAYIISVTNVSNGSFKITSYTTGGTTTESPVFNFAIFRGSVT